MAKLSRYTQQVFGSTAGANEIAKFGSLAASSPARYSGATITPALVQTLANYLGGWKDAQVGAGNPAIEDMNALCYLYAYQLTYLMQTGIPEWDAGTTYFIGSIVTAVGTGVMYVSLTDNNLNHAVSDATKWNLYANTLASTRTVVVGAAGADPGIGGLAISPTIITFDTASTSYVQVTDGANMSCVLTTSGKPVIIQCQEGSFAGSHSAGSGEVQVGFQVKRGSTGIMSPVILRTQSVANAEIFVPGSSFSFIDYGVNGLPGTYTYNMFAAWIGGVPSGAGARVRTVTMTAREML